jgi:hypothetical protein
VSGADGLFSPDPERVEVEGGAPSELLAAIALAPSPNKDIVEGSDSVESMPVVP